MQGGKLELKAVILGPQYEPLGKKKASHLWAVNLQQRRQEYTVQEDSLLARGVGKAAQPHVNQ